MIKKENVTGLILAGGAGRRVLNEDKGLLEYRNKPMVEHQIAVLKPQVSEILISANRNLEYYTSLGFQVISDSNNEFQGPLAGIYQGLYNCTTSHLFVQPVDMPNLPTNLIERILHKINTDIKFKSKCNSYYLRSSKREHYLTLLISREKLAGLGDFLSLDKKRVSEFLEKNGIKALDIDLPEESFRNFNYLEDYRL